MTHPDRQSPSERSDDLWIVGLFASSGIAAAAFVLFLAFSPPGPIGARPIVAEGSPPAAQAQVSAKPTRYTTASSEGIRR